MTNEISNTFFLIMLVAVLISWILVQLWTTAIETFFYNYMNLSRQSAWVAFLIAAFFTIMFILLASCTEISETLRENLTQVSLSPPQVVKQMVSDDYTIPT